MAAAAPAAIAAITAPVALDRLMATGEGCSKGQLLHALHTDSRHCCQATQQGSCRQSDEKIRYLKKYYNRILKSNCPPSPPRKVLFFWYKPVSAVGNQFYVLALSIDSMTVRRFFTLISRAFCISQHFFCQISFSKII